jgi:phenylacetate-CoA ligase
MFKLFDSLYKRAPVPVQNLMVSVYGWHLHHTRYGGKCRQYADRLLESQWFSPEEMKALSLSLLKDYLCFAGARVPYYESLFRKIGFRPDALRDFEELQKIPLLDKETVRKDPQQFVARNAGRLTFVSTSGTSGKPMVIYCNKDTLRRNYAFFHRQAAWNGIHIGVRRATFGARLLIPARQKKPPFWRYNINENNLYFSMYQMRAKHLPAYYERLRAFRPVEIRTYPSSLEVFARFLEKNGLDGIRPAVIVTSAETLFDRQRALFEKVFRCPVRDQYGSAEFALFISQCEAGSYHVHPEYGHVEILRNGEPAPPGEAGDIVCTGWVNRIMPFIRYRQGDSVRWSEKTSCRCGRHFPMVEEILGRQDDIIVTPEGDRIGRFSPGFEAFEGIRNMQVVQTDYDRIVVRIVRPEKFEGEEKERFLQEFSKRLGKSIRVELEYVEDIPREPNGKFRAVISRVT